jgi:uncharacterized damage-inducible protein DinB
MTLETVKLLYGHGDWATAVVLDTAEALPPDAWTAGAGPGVRSIRDNFVHMLSTVTSWLSWWDGSWSGEQAFSTQLDPADFPDVAAVRAAWTVLSARLDAFVAGLSEDEAQRELSTPTPWGMTMAGPLWQMLLLLAYHGAQHRAELAVQLSAFGCSPGELDLGWYYWGRQWVADQPR